MLYKAKVTHLFMDILKACAYFKAGKLTDNVGIAQDLDIDTIGKLFGIKIDYLPNEASKSTGRELFMRYKNGNLIFHTNPGRITNLPSGLNKLKGPKYKIKDILGFSDNESALFLRDVPDFERKYDVTLEIWEKKNLKLNKPCVKKIKSGTIRVHHDKTTDILFLITDPKTYFRCNMNKCK